MPNRPLLLLSACSALILAGPPGRAAEADALAITANIQARHLPSARFSIRSSPHRQRPDRQLHPLRRFGTLDRHYLAAEAFRYKVTQAPDALSNVKGRLPASIPGRCHRNEPVGTLPGCHHSPYAAGVRNERRVTESIPNSSAGWIWVGNTSRDEYSGALFGLAVAWDMVADVGIRSSISDLVTLLVDFLNGHNWSVVMPDGSSSTSFLVRPDQIETFLAIGRHVNPDHFSSFSYESQRLLFSATVPVPIGVDATSDDSYFKFNLDYINLYN